MRTLSGLGICCLVATVVMSRLAGSGELKPAAAAPLPSSDPVMLVVSFYKVLLQKEAPTLQQEKELLGLSSPLRANLLARQKGTDTDPVVLQLFRQHRELFLPLGEMSPENYLSAIQISSPFNFVRSLKGIKEKSPAGSAYVMALFVHDAKAKPPRFRTVVFEIEGGKIAAGGIYLDGFRGQMTLEKFFEMVPVKE
jgi:hypothetical protein